MTDYTPITEMTGVESGVMTPEEGLLADGWDPEDVYLGEWWKQSPHTTRKVTYAPYRGQGLAPTKVTVGALVPVGKRVVRYAPTERQGGLLAAFLDVAQKRTTLVSFANRFGLLGYNYLVPEQNKCQEGDPLPWFMAHAHTVYVLAVLSGLLKQNAKEVPAARTKLATFLKEIPDGPYALGGRVVTCPFIGSWGKKPVITALAIIRYFINANLGNTGYRLRLKTAHGLGNFFSFRALIQVIYWQLVRGFDSRSLVCCRKCGRVFVSQNPRTQFCLPEGKKKISRCKSNWNTRKSRSRKKKRRKR